MRSLRASGWGQPAWAAAAAVVVAVPLLLVLLPSTAAVDAALPREQARGTPPHPPLQRLRGTFLDLQYDGRLKYANNVTRTLTCAQCAC